MESPMLQIIRAIRPNEKLTITKFGLHVDVKLTNTETLRTHNSSLPMDHHLDTERVIDVIDYLHKKISK